MIDIIIPVYNTPISDLERCLDSIFYQSYKNYKVYIIDDGSEKIVRDFIDFYVEDKSNFIVKHIVNGGVSNARNVGIEVSSSEYIVFVDSDDTIEKDFLDDAYKLIRDNDLDIIVGGYNEVVNNKISKVRKCYDGLYIYDKYNIKLFFDKLLSGKIRNDNKEIGSAPIGRIYTRVYRRSIVENIRFNKNINMSEDTLFMIDLIPFINRIGLVSSVWYNYYQNDYSIVHTNNYKKLVNDSLEFSKEIYKRLEAENDLEVKNAYMMRIVKTFFNINSILEKNSDLELRDGILRLGMIRESLVGVDISKYIDMSDKEIKMLDNIKIHNIDSRSE